MITKHYERTGIKEIKKKKESQEQITKRKEKEKKLQRTKERATYYEQKDQYHNIGLMDPKKEYQKIERMLERYEDILFSKNVIDENIQQLLQGYQDYFQTYGENMTPMGLRTFRNSIIKTIAISQQQLLQTETLEKNYTQENAVNYFCTMYSDELQETGLNMEMTAELVGFLRDNNVPIRNIENLKEVKVKIKSFCTNTKNQ